MMKTKFVLGFILMGGLFGSPSQPQQAREKFEAKQFAESIPLFQAAMEEYSDQRPHLNYNIAQAHLMQDSVVQALSYYSKASNIGKRDAQLSSLAWNQIGGLHASKFDQLQAAAQQAAQASGQPQAGGQNGEKQANPLEIALEDYKNALRFDPNNETARYNYELIKRKLQQQQQQQDQQQEDEDENENQEKENEEKNEQDDQKKDQQEQNKKDKGEQQKDPEQTKENKGGQNQNQQPGEGEEQKMSMEQAKMLLDALNENEKKFLQQLEKAKEKRSPRNRGPEW